MKQQVKKFFSFFNKTWLLFSLKSKEITGSTFYFTRFSIAPNNLLKIIGTTISRVQLNITGNNNTVECNNAYVAGTTITIEGSNNKITLAPGVMLRDSSITLRGENCSIIIGDRTTFGGVRMVNVGKQNAITIGSDCLFSDNIELWASDTHSILNEAGEFINPERPINIGNKVWVGSKVIILKGITIADGSIIGMGSVVTKDVPAGVISAGYPNKTIKENISWKLDY